MTQPQDITKASQQYQNWLTNLKEEAMLETHNQSQAMMRSVLQCLRNFQSTQQVLDLANSLPPLPRGVFIENWYPTDKTEQLNSAEEFSLLVKKDLSPHHIPPETIVSDVFKVLNDVLEVDNIIRIKNALPEKLKALWPKTTP